MLPEAAFTQAVAALPLVSIDLCITDAQDNLFLGQRNNAPAKQWWFTPGVRIRKNEAIGDALTRLLHDELRLHAALSTRAALMGAWDHFYPDSAFDANVSTHYVNLPHWLRLTQDEADALRPSEGALEQHSGWRWLPLWQAADEPTVHRYVQVYARWLLRALNPDRR